ncbi:MAG: efflux transporter outer membrane subunit [Rubrivivax sp.]|nr:efflux transporter outer membrane subunit [Rubrivivax sp.]
MPPRLAPRPARPKGPGRWPVILSFPSLLLAACASVPGPVATDLPPEVPTQWSAAAARAGAAATDLTAWWRRFDDPALVALVTTSLNANAGVKSAQAALRQARALADVARAGLGPSASLSGSAQRSQSGSSDAGNTFTAGLGARWEPDVFGGQRAAVDASVTDALASAATLSNVQVALAAEVASSYITLRGQQARLAIARSNLATQTQTLQITRWRAQAGLVSSLDVAQAVSAAEQTRAQIPALQTSVTQTLNALAVLTGQAPGALNGSLGDATPIPPAPADLALAFPADTLRQRPDVRAAELKLRSAWSRVAMADAARYPSFSLSGSLGLSALSLGRLTDSASLVRSLLASVSAPLFDGGAAQAQVRAQDAVLDQARASYQDTVLGALQDVEDALVAIQGDRERLARLQAAATAAGNAELLARQRYQSGLIDFASVLGTQRTLLTAQDSVASTQASLSASHVQLYRALGGGWTPEAEAAAAPRAANARGL